MHPCTCVICKTRRGTGWISYTESALNTRTALIWTYINNTILKVKLSLCLNKHHAMRRMGDCRYSTTLSWPWHQMEVSHQLHPPPARSASPEDQNSRHPLHTRMCGPLSRFEWCRDKKIAGNQIPIHRSSNRYIVWALLTKRVSYFIKYMYLVGQCRNKARDIV